MKRDEILSRVKSLDSFRGIPKSYWIAGIRNGKDNPDEFDDEFVLFKREEEISRATGTTNPGIYSLKCFNTYNNLGSAVVKADEWYYDVWKYGLHKNRMRALRQVKPITYYRDNDKDLKSEEIGKEYRGMIGINFHTITYLAEPRYIKQIGKWSYGCQVCNNTEEYFPIIDKCKNQASVTYCLIKE